MKSGWPPALFHKIPLFFKWWLPLYSMGRVLENIETSQFAITENKGAMMDIIGAGSLWKKSIHFGGSPPPSDLQVTCDFNGKTNAKWQPGEIWKLKTRNPSELTSKGKWGGEQTDSRSWLASKCITLDSTNTVEKTKQILGNILVKSNW